MERKFEDRWADDQWILWQTRTLAQYIAATVPLEEGGNNDLLDQANEIGQDFFKEDEEDEEPIIEDRPRNTQPINPQPVRTEELDAPPPMTAAQMERIADKNGPMAFMRFQQVFGARGGGLDR